MIWTEPRRGLRLVKPGPFVTDARQCTPDDPCDLCIAVTPAVNPQTDVELACRNCLRDMSKCECGGTGLAWSVLFGVTLGLVLGAGLLTCADIAADLIARALGWAA